jgi:O-methyltransferase
LHLFDSFLGLPEPRAEVDGALAVREADGRSTGALKPVGIGAVPLDEAQQLLEKEVKYPAHLIKFHVGWFQQTLPCDADEIEQIALLRIDGDWYDSTKVCLDYLYSKVCRNGVIVIDDYGHYDGCRRAVTEFLTKLKEPIMLHHIDYSGRYWIKP